MTKAKAIRIYTKPKPPKDKNVGYVELMIDDTHNLFSEIELYLFKNLLFGQKEDHLSGIAGKDMTAFLTGDGIADYEEKHFDIDFLYPLNQKDIKDIKNRAKEMIKHLSAKEEDDFNLSSSDESILGLIIDGLEPE